MKITVIGTGYVGLVTGACFADVGNHVTCLDVDEHKVRQLRQGILPIHEPGLDEIVVRNSAASRLLFTSEYDDAVGDADVFFIAVGTPTDRDGSADLRYVSDAAEQLGRRLNRDCIVVVKSTVPVGTTERVRGILLREIERRGLHVDVAVASNPEFLKEGFAVRDFMHPDRILIGTDDPRAIDTLRVLYTPFNRNRDRLMLLDTRSSEFSKYAANAMLATRISFMNELSRLAEALGADIESVRQALGADARIGPSFLYAGVGFGGSCFPKDLRAIVAMAAENAIPAQLLDSVQAVNEAQKRVAFEKLRVAFGDLAGRTIAVWGLAFKPNTDDMREAPSLDLIRALVESGANVRGYDPVAAENARYALADCGDAVRIVGSAVEACEGADALAVVTEWLEFRSPDFRWLARTLKERLVLDGRNLYDPKFVRAAGLRYVGIGRGFDVDLLAPASAPLDLPPAQDAMAA